jgi:hypothetical protein
MASTPEAGDIIVQVISYIFSLMGYPAKIKGKYHKISDFCSLFPLFLQKSAVSLP